MQLARFRQGGFACEKKRVGFDVASGKRLEFCAARSPVT
jgi:hypothetical protein